MADDTAPSALLEEIRRNLRVFGASGIDMARLLAALDAVLKLAGGWNALWPCSAQVREAITRELTRKDGSEDEGSVGA